VAQVSVDAWCELLLASDDALSVLRRFEADTMVVPVDEVPDAACAALA